MVVRLQKLPKKGDVVFVTYDMVEKIGAGGQFAGSIKATIGDKIEDKEWDNTYPTYEYTLEF